MFILKSAVFSQSKFLQLHQLEQQHILVECSFATHLCEWLFLGDVSILGRFIAARLSLVLLAEADRPEGPLFLLENEKTCLIAIGKLIACNYASYFIEGKLLNWHEQLMIYEYVSMSYRDMRKIDIFYQARLIKSGSGERRCKLPYLFLLFGFLIVWRSGSVRTGRGGLCGRRDLRNLRRRVSRRFLLRLLSFYFFLLRLLKTKVKFSSNFVFWDVKRP